MMFSSRKAENGSPRARPERRVCCSGEMMPDCFHCSNRVSIVMRGPCPIGLSLVHQLSRQIGVFGCEGFCLLFEVGTRGMASFHDFIVVEGLVEFFHLCGEFTGVDGAYSVVFRCRED